METKIVVRAVLWIISLILVNAIWADVSQGQATIELNDLEHPFEQSKNFSISGFVGASKPIPAEIHVEFVGQGYEGDNVSWQIWHDSKIVESWSGQMNGEKMTVQTELPVGDFEFRTSKQPGMYVIETIDVQPFIPYKTTGHLLISGGLVLFALVETAIRKVAAKTIPKTADSKPSKYEVPSSMRGIRVPVEQEIQEYDDAQGPWRDPLIG